VAEGSSAERRTLAVVIPTLDEAGSLPRLFASLGWSSGAGAPPDGDPDAPDAVVVADGGSRDATVAVARAHGAQVLAARRGRGSQLAAGARLAPAELLLFLHADARVLPGSLARLRAAFDAPDLVAAGMRQRIDARALIYRAIERAADLRTSLGRVYGDSGLAVRRSAYEAAGGFADLPLFEDLDLARRLRPLGRVALVEGAVVEVSARRWREEGVARRTLMNWLLTAGFWLGVDPARLERHYRPRRKGWEQERA
jgi:rSAM/selenodomain-associated transferase 2